MKLTEQECFYIGDLISERINPELIELYGKRKLTKKEIIFAQKLMYKIINLT